jgi:hypothetical protein
MHLPTRISRKLRNGRVALIDVIQRDLVLLNLGLGIGYVLLWGFSIYQKLYQQADFISFYSAGAIIRDGLGADLYNFDLQMQYQSNIISGLELKNGPLAFINPPFTALPFAILAQLPLIDAYLIWAFVQFGLLAWLLWLLDGILKEWDNQIRRLVLSAVIAFPYVLVNIVQGSFSLFLLVCLVQLYLAIKQGREYHAGFWIIGGVIKPQIILLAGVFLVGLRRWKTILFALIGGFTLFTISNLFFGLQIWPAYLNSLSIFSSAYNQLGVFPNAMYNFRGMLTVLLKGVNPLLISQINLLALLGTIPFVLAIWWKHQDIKDKSFELRLSLTLMLGLFFNPHLYPHDGLFLVLPALLFYIYLRQSNLPYRAFSIFCLSSPYILLISDYIIGDRLGIRVPVLMMGVFIAWISVALYHDYRNSNKLVSIHETA